MHQPQDLSQTAAREAQRRRRRDGPRAIDLVLEEYHRLPAGDRREPLLNRVISHLSFN